MKAVPTRRPPLLQLIWDISNTTVTDATLARRYSLSIVTIRRYRLAVDRFSGKEVKDPKDKMLWMKKHKNK